MFLVLKIIFTLSLILYFNKTKHSKLKILEEIYKKPVVTLNYSLFRTNQEILSKILWK